MSKSSLGKHSALEFYGFDKLVKKLDMSEKQIKESVSEALIRSAVYPKKDMLDFMKKHRLTGTTEESWEDANVYWEGTKCKGDIGFSIDKGGIASLMLDIGTPKIKPSFFIYYAINNNRKRIKEEQNKALEEILKKGGLL